MLGVTDSVCDEALWMSGVIVLSPQASYSVHCKESAESIGCPWWLSALCFC